MYNTKIWMNDNLIGNHEDLQDPFINTSVDVSWMDRFKSLFTKKWIIRVVAWADPLTVKRTMNMDRADWSQVFVEGEASNDRF